MNKSYQAIQARERDRLRKESEEDLLNVCGVYCPLPDCFSYAFSDQIFECQNCVLNKNCQTAFISRNYETLSPELDFVTSLHCCKLFDFCTENWWSYFTLRRKLKDIGTLNISWFLNKLIVSDHVEIKEMHHETYYRFKK